MNAGSDTITVALEVPAPGNPSAAAGAAPHTHSPDEVAAAAERSRRLLRHRALLGGVAGAVPVPGLDWAIDAALLSRLIPRINQEFGLAPEHLDALDPTRRERVQKAVALVGSVLIGRLVTRDLVLRAATAIGWRRLTQRQLTRLVPIAGQLASAALGYATVRYLGEQHIQDCIRVASLLRDADAEGASVIEVPAAPPSPTEPPN